MDGSFVVSSPGARGAWRRLGNRGANCALGSPELRTAFKTCVENWPGRVPVSPSFGSLKTNIRSTGMPTHAKAVMPLARNRCSSGGAIYDQELNAGDRGVL